MWLLPWLTEQYTSPLLPAELLQQLRAHTSPSPSLKTMFDARPSTYFIGTVEEDSFKLYRNGWGRTSTLFLGWVTPCCAGTGSILRLRYRAHGAALFLEPIRLIFLLFVLTALVKNVIGNADEAWEALFIASVVMMMLALPLLLFRREVRKARPFLRQLLQLTKTTK